MEPSDQAYKRVSDYILLLYIDRIRIAISDQMAASQLFREISKDNFKWKMESHLIGFHCQQAVEKTYKAFLYLFEPRNITTHDLENLLAACIKYDNGLNDSTRRKFSTELNPYAVKGRYSGVVTQKETMREYVAFAQGIDSFVAGRALSLSKDKKYLLLWYKVHGGISKFGV